MAKVLESWIGYLVEVRVNERLFEIDPPLSLTIQLWDGSRIEFGQFPASAFGHLKKLVGMRVKVVKEESDPTMDGRVIFDGGTRPGPISYSIFATDEVDPFEKRQRDPFEKRPRDPWSITDDIYAMAEEIWEQLARETGFGPRCRSHVPRPAPARRPYDIEGTAENWVEPVALVGPVGNPGLLEVP